MTHLRRSYILERLVYIVIWLVVFLIPVLMSYWSINSDSDRVFNWPMITHIWVYVILPFFFLFCLNNFWLAPYFLLKKKYVRYAILVFMIVGAFIGIDVVFVSKEMKENFHFRNINRKEMMDRRTNEHERSFTRAPDFQQEEPVQREYPPGGAINDSIGYNDPMRGGEFGRGPGPFPGVMFVPFISRFLIAFLMIGFNIAVKLIFKSLRDEEIMKELERRKLQSELDSLKYQINPHFFMNTLNNIHALVDINKEQAQKAIVELSKMMRYVLYEANHNTILLEREVLFLKNYIELMKLRYIDKVNVKVSLPDEVPLVEIPPLLYISFIENAFKHGVSYQHESLIYVAMQIEEGYLTFTCSNTNNGQSEEQHCGVGLENIQKRLKLLYKNKYTLSINDSSDSFNILLIIPLI